MNEPRHSAWQAWIAASGFVLLILFAFVLKRPSPEPRAAPAPAPAPIRSAPAANTPVAPPPLDRSALIEAARRAGSAWATGAPAPEAGLAGRSFRLSIPFGCEGPAEGETMPAMGWRYDEAAETLRIRVAPQTFTDTPLLRAIVEDAEFETAEGFWVDRPWILSDACPARAPAEDVAVAAEADAAEQRASPKAVSDDAERGGAGGGEAGEGEAGAGAVEPPAPSPRQSLGIVELSAPGAPRARRRDGQAYQLVRRIAPDALAAERGFRLLVEGRIEAPAGQSALGCHAARRTLPPRCLIFARIARVAIENGTTGEMLGEWR